MTHFSDLPWYRSQEWTSFLLALGPGLSRSSPYLPPGRGARGAGLVTQKLAVHLHLHLHVRAMHVHAEAVT